jgi:hypothetical protein
MRFERNIVFWVAALAVFVALLWLPAVRACSIRWPIS